MGVIGVVIVAFIAYFLFSAIKENKEYEKKKLPISQIVRGNNQLKIENIKWFQYKKGNKKGTHTAAEWITVSKSMNMVRLSPFLAQVLSNGFQDLSIDAILAGRNNDEVIMLKPLFGHNEEILLIFSDDHIFGHGSDGSVLLERDAAWRFTDVF